MRQRSWKTLAPALGLLAVGSISYWHVFNNAPAFTESLRTPSIFGDWRVVTPSSLYNKSDYYFDLAYGYLRGDVADFLVEDTKFTSEEIYEARLERAAELLKLSIAAAPAQAKSWTTLATIYALLGKSDDAVRALRTSWGLAPQSLSETPDRLFVVSILNGDLTAAWQNDSDRKSIIADLRLARRYNPQFLNGL